MLQGVRGDLKKMIKQKITKLAFFCCVLAAVLCISGCFKFDFSIPKISKKDNHFESKYFYMWYPKGWKVYHQKGPWSSKKILDAKDTAIEKRLGHLRIETVRVMEARYKDYYFLISVFELPDEIKRDSRSIKTITKDIIESESRYFKASAFLNISNSSQGISIGGYPAQKVIVSASDSSGRAIENTSIVFAQDKLFILQYAFGGDFSEEVKKRIESIAYSFTMK